MKARKSLVSIILGVVLSPFIVYARDASIFPKFMDNFLIFLFQSLPEYARSTVTVASAYFKFLLWMLLFAALFYSTKKMFKDDARIAGAISFFMSLLSVILIPDKVVIFIFETYSIVISLLFALVPFFAAMWFNHKVLGGESHRLRFFRGLVYIFAGIVVGYVAGAIEGGIMSGYSTALHEDMGSWMTVAAIICWIFGILNMMGGAGTSAARAWNEYPENTWPRNRGGGGGSGPYSPPRGTRNINEARLNRLRDELDAARAALRTAGTSGTARRDILRRISAALGEMERIRDELTRL